MRNMILYIDDVKKVSVMFIINFIVLPDISMIAETPHDWYVIGPFVEIGHIVKVGSGDTTVETTEVLQHI